MSHWRCCCGGCPINGNNLVVGGQFDTAGNVDAGHIAAWGYDADGVGRWIPMQGLNGNVHALASIDGVLYAGGEFTASIATESLPAIPLKYLARWECDRWMPVGPGQAQGGGVNGPVRAIKQGRALGGTQAGTHAVLIAGDFTFSTTGVQLLSHTAEITGVFGDACTAALSGFVRAIGFNDVGGAEVDPARGDAVFGGVFTAPGSIKNVSNAVGQFHMTVLNSLGFNGDGLNGTVFAALHRYRDIQPIPGQPQPVDIEEVWLGGNFTSVQVGNIPPLPRFFRMQRYAGGGNYEVHSVSGFTSGAVHALFYSPSRSVIIAGGSFVQVVGQTFFARRIAQVDLQSTQITPIGGAGLGGDVNAVCEFNGDLIVGGAFTTDGAGTTPIARVGQLAGNGWLPLGGVVGGSGVAGGPVQALCEHDFGSLSRMGAVRARIASRLNRMTGGLRASLGRRKEVAP